MKTLVELLESVSLHGSDFCELVSLQIWDGVSNRCVNSFIEAYKQGAGKVGVSWQLQIM